MTQSPAHTCQDNPSLVCPACSTPVKHNLRECPAMRALESLTPGGSEYIDDIKRCTDTVRDTMHRRMDALKEWRKNQNEKNAKIKVVLQALLINQHHHIESCGGRYICNDPSVCLRCAAEELIKTL